MCVGAPNENRWTAPRYVQGVMMGKDDASEKRENDVRRMR